MLTKEVSQNYFKNALFSLSIHDKRAESLFETAWALTQQADLSIASLGKNRAGKAFVKHKIKSVDRLVGNDHLYREIPFIYKNFYQPFLASLSTIYLIVDWSGCCRSDIHMLRASLVYSGRSITIYNEVHPIDKLGNTKIQNKFLQQLKNRIPLDKKVVVITDAGFVTPWFKQVLKLGWDYLGRIKSNVKLLFEDKPRWMQAKNLHKEAKKQGHFVGKAIVGKKTSTPVNGNIYSYKQTIKKKKSNKKKSQSALDKRYSKANSTPWILATSLKGYSKQDMKEIYGYRMQIEQTFRDDKDPKFGFGWRFSGSKCIKRVSILCLIANIAAFFLLTFGATAEKMGEHRKYQVNTIRKRRVLSLLNLAKQILKLEPPIELTKKYHESLNQILHSAKILYGV